MSMNELNSTARDLMSIRAMIEELQAEAEALTDKLKAAMVEQGAETLQGDGWKASWKNVSSQRFNSKAFKANSVTAIFTDQLILQRLSVVLSEETITISYITEDL